jgi:hypothetical protein
MSCLHSRWTPSFKPYLWMHQWFLYSDLQTSTGNSSEVWVATKMALGCLLTLFRHLDALPTGPFREEDEIINSREYNSPWNANSLLASQETLLNMWNLKIYCHVHKWPLAVLIQSTCCQRTLFSPFYCHVHKWPLAVLIQSTCSQHTLFSPFYYFHPFYNQTWSLRIL